MASASDGSSPVAGAGSPSGSRGTAPFSPKCPTYDDTVTDRWIELDGLVNMRDLGGLPTGDGGHTASGRLIRSDNLQDLSEADVEHLVEALGVTDIVDLRTERGGARRGSGAVARGRVTHPPPPLADRREARRRPGCRGRQGARPPVARREEDPRRRGSGPTTTSATSRPARTRCRPRCGSSPTPRAPRSSTARPARTAPARSWRWRSTWPACPTSTSSPTTC